MLETINKPIEFDNVTIFITEFLSKRNLEAPIAAALFTYHFSIGAYTRLTFLLCKQTIINATFNNKY
ncbi:hypothetical protein [Pseudoalteromonas sp. SIMBA_162]|uniref:hypothetical protein n=1 Tax=Pseudoalteromonas sp. SIMBA_162 TaxID=3080867 RepID=UPI0039789101